MSLGPSQRSVSYAFKILLIILDTRNEALGILTGDNEVVLQTWLLVILGTLRSEDGDGRESIAEKVNSRSFNLHRDSLRTKSLPLSNVGEPS